MTRKQLLKIHLNAIRFSVKERAFDLANISVPIFLTVGIIAMSVKFWSWLLGLGI